MPKTSLKLKGLSLDRLETLSAIVSQGGIARAAGGDSNKQSLFSRQAAELEEWFGVDLLDRASAPSKPTQAALRIAREVDEFLREMESIRQAASEGRQTVCFGAGERMIRSYLIPWAAKMQNENIRFVFRNLTSTAIRSELIAKRLDFGILRKDKCPSGMATFKLKTIPMCLLLPETTAGTRRKWSWKNLEGLPLVLLEGEGQFVDFLNEKASSHGVQLDAAIECSTWSQVIDAMNLCRNGGFLPQDMEPLYPSGFIKVPLAGLSDYTDEFVIAWSATDMGKKPEINRLVTKLGINSKASKTS
jgi:DNA-binding transcriptional LysR family regulator